MLIWTPIALNYLLLFQFCIYSGAFRIPKYDYKVLNFIVYINSQSRKVYYINCWHGSLPTVGHWTYLYMLTKPHQSTQDLCNISSPPAPLSCHSPPKCWQHSPLKRKFLCTYSSSRSWSCKKKKGLFDSVFMNTVQI